MNAPRLRPSELGGRWYPASAEACLRFFESVPRGSSLPPTRAGAIVPHAGWVYSGAIAFEALAAVADAHPRADLVILFGGHLSPSDSPRLLVEGAFETPFGPLLVPEPLTQDIAMAIECELETPDDYVDDNGVEVLVPMLKRLWPEAPAVLMGIPPTSRAAAIGVEVLDLAQRRGFSDIVVIGSTDLTHYGPNYDYRPAGSGPQALDWVKSKNDPAVIEPLSALDATRVIWVAERQRNACCAGAAAAAVAAARKLHADQGIVTRYATSFDVRPDGPAPTSFVGYVGMVLGSTNKH
jgi:AmmeMemoRadiSam system protein B